MPSCESTLLTAATVDDASCVGIGVPPIEASPIVNRPVGLPSPRLVASQCSAAQLHDAADHRDLRHVDLGVDHRLARLVHPGRGAVRAPPSEDPGQVGFGEARVAVANGAVVGLDGLGDGALRHRPLGGVRGLAGVGPHRLWQVLPPSAAVAPVSQSSAVERAADQPVVRRLGLGPGDGVAVVGHGRPEADAEGELRRAGVEHEELRLGLAEAGRRPPLHAGRPATEAARTTPRRPRR